MAAKRHCWLGASAGAVLIVLNAPVAAQEPSRPGVPAPSIRHAGKPVVSEYAPNVPPVFLSARHAQLCRVLVGDEFPAIELPQLGAGRTKLSAIAGEKATVVLFWTPGAWMSRAALADIGRDIAAKARDSSVGVIGVVVGGSPEDAQEELGKTDAKFSQLIDADGTALAQIGTDSLPRVYVLDGNHRIAWFDVEYSEATRRELQQTLAALTASK